MICHAAERERCGYDALRIVLHRLAPFFQGQGMHHWQIALASVGQGDMIKLLVLAKQLQPAGSHHIAHAERFGIGLLIDESPERRDHDLWCGVPCTHLGIGHLLNSRREDVSLVAIGRHDMRPTVVLQYLHRHAEQSLRFHLAIVVAFAANVHDRGHRHSPCCCVGSNGVGSNGVGSSCVGSNGGRCRCVGLCKA